MKIGLVQANNGRDVVANINSFEKLFAPLQGADLIITPECSNLMGYNPKKDKLASMDTDEMVMFAREKARQMNSPILLGSVLVYDEIRGGAVNRQILIDGNGEINKFYDKIHMFDVDLPNGEKFRESEQFLPGNEGIITKLGDAVLGHTICFDLRFGTLYRDLARSGANVIVVPSAFTKFTGRAHWEVLLRARAIATGSFILAPAQCGNFTHHDGSVRENYGHSMIVSPWGSILRQMAEFPASLLYDLDLNDVKRVRSQISTLELSRDYSISAGQ